MDDSYCLRLLTTHDYYKSYFSLLEQLSSMENVISEQDFKNRVKERQANGVYTWVIEDKKKIIATITLLIEKKFYHSGKCTGHIEDVIVDSEHRNKNIGGYMLDFVLKKAKDLHCYKVVLGCTDPLENFYSSKGFQASHIQMTYYF